MKESAKMPLKPPDIKELKSIVDWVHLTGDVRELSIKFGDVELFISRDRQSSSVQPVAAPMSTAAALNVEAPVLVAAPATTAPPAPSSPASASTNELAADEVLIKAPMVGIYYACPKPGAPAFVSVGDTVSANTVLCIVEVMKLMNNVEAQVDGTVVRILVADNQAVEYGQPLMVVRRSS